MSSIFEALKDDRAAIMKFTDGEGNSSEFAIDVTTSINTALSASVTEFPVEGRGTITDHIQPAPVSLSLQCMISESPSQQLLTLATGLLGAGLKQLTTDKLTGQFAGAVAAASMAVNSSMTGKVKPSYSDDTGFGEVDFGPLLSNRKDLDVDFPKRAMIGLIKMFQAGTIFSLHTFFTQHLYTDMVMTSLSFSQTPKEGESLSFSMSCKQISVTTAFSQVDSLELKASNPAGGSLTPKVDKGKASKKVQEKVGPSVFKKMLK